MKSGILTIEVKSFQAVLRREEEDSHVAVFSCALLKPKAAGRSAPEDRHDPLTVKCSKDGVVTIENKDKTYL